MYKTKLITGIILTISLFSLMGCTSIPMTKTIHITETKTITTESELTVDISTVTKNVPDQMIYYQCLRCAYIEEIPDDVIIEKLPERKWCPACHCGSCGVMYLFIK